MYDINKLIDICLAEVGYKEKKSNKSLDSKEANAGPGNYTKYGRDLVKWIGAPYANGVQWCDEWVDWCFIKAYGLNAAKKLLGGWSAYTPTSAQYYKNHGRYYRKNPKVGDQIFFKNSKDCICHTGIVYKVTNAYVHTAEGNANNQVMMKKYSINNASIDGYGRPNYGDQVVNTIAKVGYNEAWPKLSPSLKKGDKGDEVIRLQRFLNWFGGYGLAVDGHFGPLTENAVKDFQKKVGITTDGHFGPISLAAAQKVVK